MGHLLAILYRTPHVTLMMGAVAFFIVWLAITVSLGKALSGRPFLSTRTMCSILLQLPLAGSIGIMVYVIGTRYFFQVP